MTLHSSLFFKDPINYLPGRVKIHGMQTVVPEMTDNDYKTFSSQADVDMDVSEDSNATRITHIFLKAKNIDAYTFTPTGGAGAGFSNRSLLTTVTNYEGESTSTTVSGFQHDLYPLPAAITATTARLQFTGTHPEIYALMLLDIGIEIDANSRFTQIDFQKVDRTGTLTTNPTGRTRRNPPFAGTRFKWEGAYVCQFRGESVSAFLAWLEANPNFAFAQEFSRYPARVFPTANPSTRIRNGYLNPEAKSNGEFVQFRVSER